jgi:hypothetical protein
VNLYLLSRPFGTVGYDENAALVVRAETEHAARLIASSVSCQEGKAVWLDGVVSVALLATGARGEPGAVLVSFRAG